MASPSAPETRTLASAFVASEDTCPTVASLPVPTSPSSHAARVTRSRPSSARVAARALVAASATVEAAAPRATKPKKTAKSCGQPRKRARTATSSKKAPVEDEEEDSKPAATESCCICMSDVETDDLAKISGCDHLFCFGCIEKWAERENSCPLCKIRFTKIDRVNKKRKKGQSNTKRVKQRDQRSDLPGSALESLLASLARRGPSLILSRSTFAVGLQAGLEGGPTSILSGPSLSGMFDDSDDEETPFSAFLRAFHNAPMPTSYQQLRPVSLAAAAMNNRSYASNSNETTAGNQENPLTIDDDSDEEVVEVVGFRAGSRRYP